MQLHIVVPTILSQPQYEVENVELLSKQFTDLGLKHTLYFVSNIPDAVFDAIEFKSPNVIKSVSNLNFSISRALNSVFESIEFENDDVLGFIQTDCRFGNEKWIKYYLDILFDEKYNAGVLGQRPHLRCNVVELHEVYNDLFSFFRAFWTDGTMLFKGSTLRNVGLFDENYFGDCESQDFCYRVHEAGFTNYWISDNESFFKYQHKSVNFGGKAKKNHREFLDKVDKSRKYFDSKWRQFELDNMGKTSW